MLGVALPQKFFQNFGRENFQAQKNFGVLFMNGGVVDDWKLFQNFVDEVFDVFGNIFGHEIKTSAGFDSFFVNHVDDQIERNIFISTAHRTEPQNFIRVNEIVAYSVVKIAGNGIDNFFLGVLH